MNTKSFLAALALCAVTLVGIQTVSKADATVSKLPENLISAEALDAKLMQGNGSATDDIVADQDLGSDETPSLDLARGGIGIRPGHGGYLPGRGGYVPGRGGYFPGPRPYYPGPFPGPYPYPRGLVSCYAQSTANGLTYMGTAYFAADAQNAALSICFNSTGYQCVPRGCY